MSAARSGETGETRRTVCNRDCPDACAIVATVEDGRVTRLAGDPAHPVTRGALCYRTSRFLARQYSPERITTPLVRDGDRFVPISWEAALDLVGWGMGRRSNGGSIVRALDALAAITGNLGVPGGGVSFYFKRRGAFDTSFIRGESVAPRTVCEPLLGPELLALADPPVRAVWVTAGNPVAMLPESETTVRALTSREFVVVVDAFLTDTARCAHLVLPTTTLLEDDDLLGAYGHHWIGVSRPVIPPPPGVRTDLEIMQGLAARLGAGLAAAMAGAARAWKRRLVAGRLAPAGVSLERLESEGPLRNPLAPRVLFADRRFATPSGRVNLIHARTAPPPPPGPPPGWPLQLLALSTDKAQSSQWSRPLDGPLEVTVHPDSAAGLVDGTIARMESRIASIPVRVRHDARQRRDVALCAKGGHLADGRCANALVRARVTDIGEGGALYEEFVRLVPPVAPNTPAPPDPPPSR
jgi:anaerobic selenocysteine-containing dehydrogenase